MRHLWSRGLLRVAAATLVVLAGCADDPPPPDPPTATGPPATTAPTAPPTTAPKTTSRLLTDPAAVLTLDDPSKFDATAMAAIQGLVRATQANIAAHLHPVDPGDASLRATNTGKYLDVLTKVFNEDRDKGVALSEPTILVLRPGSVVVETPSRIQVAYCYTTNAHLYDIKTRQLQEDDGVYSIHRLSMMELVGGTWTMVQKLDYFTWEGSPACLGPI